MKNKTSITYLIIIIASLSLGCRGPVKEEPKSLASAGTVSAGQKYSINTRESVVTWKGFTAFGSHTGYVHISKGDLRIEKGQIMGDTVIVDMNTIEDETHSGNSGLIKHLKDPDFFDVQRFPVAAIVLTKSVPLNNGNIRVSGNLTIKGITHPVTFPAKLEVKDGIATMDGRLVIDRTLWGIRYKSGKFFDNLKEDTILDDIEFNIKIVAKK